MNRHKAKKRSLIVLFDGDCAICSRTIHFITQRAPADHFEFIPLKSDNAKKMLTPWSIDPEKIDSVLLIENNNVYGKSTAILRIMKHLKGLWPVLWFFIIVPPPLRDYLYDRFAQHRHRFSKIFKKYM